MRRKLSRKAPLPYFSRRSTSQSGYFLPRISVAEVLDEFSKRYNQKQTNIEISKDRNISSLQKYQLYKKQSKYKTHKKSQTSFLKQLISNRISQLHTVKIHQLKQMRNNICQKRQKKKIINKYQDFIVSDPNRCSFPEISTSNNKQLKKNARIIEFRKIR